MDGHRILIATHDEEVSGKLAHMLVRRYEVVQSLDGDEVLNLLENADPDFIILDGELPKVDGFAISKAVRRKANLERTPVFLFSSRSTREDFKRGYDAGVTLYMAKPVDLIRLARQVDFTIQRDQLKPKIKHYSPEVLRHQGIKAQPKGGLKSMTRSQVRAVEAEPETGKNEQQPAEPAVPGAGLKQVLASITGTVPPFASGSNSNAQIGANAAPAMPQVSPPVQPPSASLSEAELEDLDLDVSHTAPAATVQTPPVVPPQVPSNPNVKEEIARLIGAKLNLGSERPQTPAPGMPGYTPPTPPPQPGEEKPRRIVFADLIGKDAPITPKPSSAPVTSATNQSTAAETGQPAAAAKPRPRLNLSELIANIPTRPIPETPPPDPVAPSLESTASPSRIEGLDDLDLGQEGSQRSVPGESIQ